MPWRALAVAIVALLALALAISVLRSDGAEDRREAEAAQARLEAAERLRLEEEGRPASEAGPGRLGSESGIAYRARLIAAAESVITADARARARTGEIDRDVKGTRCRPFPYTATREAQERDPGIDRNRYQCLAWNKRFALSELEGKARTGYIGQPYWLIADYATGHLTFCKITPRPGEGGKALVSVPVAPACRDPLS